MPLKKIPRLVIADDNLSLNNKRHASHSKKKTQCKTTVVTLIRSMQTIALATVRVFPPELGITCGMY